MVLGTSASPESREGEKRARTTESPLRLTRIKCGLTQMKLAKLAGMHRNSLRKLENDPTREVAPNTAKALAAALEVPVAELGLRVRTPRRSIRLRKLTAEQRHIVDEILSLPPEDYGLICGAIENLRQARRRERGRRPRR